MKHVQRHKRHRFVAGKENELCSRRRREPKVGKMNRKGRIVVVLVSLGLVPGVASSAAFAGSPLLSGYGGPGAGEQAVIGSTLIGAPGGGAGSGGSSGSSGSAGSAGSGSAGSASAGGGSASTSAATSAVTGGSSAGGSSAGGNAGGGAGGKGASGAAGGHRGGSHATGSASTRAGASNTGAQTHAFVYPTGLRSASVDSPALGISGSDLLLFLAAIATLALVAVATLRLSRLQREL